MLASLALAIMLNSHADLVVQLPDLASGGQVQVALFNSAAGWKSRTQAVRSATVAVTGAVTEARFVGLPPGVYGVMAYHDRNSNGRLDTLPIGLPIEPYGFSNNARGTFGPPSWKAAGFTIQVGEAKDLSIRLH